MPAAPGSAQSPGQLRFGTAMSSPVQPPPACSALRGTQHSSFCCPSLQLLDELEKEPGLKGAWCCNELNAGKQLWCVTGRHRISPNSDGTRLRQAL